MSAMPTGVGSSHRLVYLDIHTAIRLTEENVSQGGGKYCYDCAELAPSTSEEQDSAKIRMVLKLLGDIKARSNAEEKTIIFSQFTSMLDLIQPFLRKRGIRFVRCKWCHVSKTHF
jgi:SNF2 family DNA or RNA helicase